MFIIVKLYFFKPLVCRNSIINKIEYNKKNTNIKYEIILNAKIKDTRQKNIVTIKAWILIFILTPSIKDIIAMTKKINDIYIKVNSIAAYPIVTPLFQVKHSTKLGIRKQIFINIIPIGKNWVCINFNEGIISSDIQLWFLSLLFKICNAFNIRVLVLALTGG